MPKCHPARTRPFVDVPGPKKGAGMVGKIQIGTKSAVASMEAGVGQATRDVDLATEAARRLQELSASLHTAVSRFKTS